MENITVQPADLRELSALRNEYRARARCQIVHDSILPRSLAQPFQFIVDGQAVGYAGVWTKYYPGRVLEFYLRPDFEPMELRVLSALRVRSGARELEAQTNIPGSEALLCRSAAEVWTEKLLFAQGKPTDLEMQSLRFRSREPQDNGPEGDWVVEENGEVLGAGGIMTHYNPPYGDIYFEVVESARGRGVGRYLVQELRKACASMGLIAAARCSPENIGSQRALERGGFVRCGALMAGTLGDETC